MDTPQTDLLKKDIQRAIDLIAAKDYNQATLVLADAGDTLDEILDHSADDEDLIEISRYQVLLNQLQQKIANAS